MKELVKKIAKDCSTGIGGEIYDPARVIGYSIVVIGGFTFIALSIYDTIINKKFDYNGFAMGLGGIGVSLTATAAGVWFKRDSEPLHQTKTL